MPTGSKDYSPVFLDDCLLFCRSNVAECQKIQLLLEWYETTSGQQVNRAKTTIFFSRNTFEEVQQEIEVV